VVQLPPAIRYLPLPGACLVRRVTEVDLLMQVAPLGRHLLLLGLQALQLLAELVDVLA
jgi:hypothetical protein